MPTREGLRALFLNASPIREPGQKGDDHDTAVGKRRRFKEVHEQMHNGHATPDLLTEIPEGQLTP